MALIYLGYRALKKKMGDGNEEEELTEEEKAQKLAEPVKESKVKCKLFLFVDLFHKLKHGCKFVIYTV